MKMPSIQQVMRVASLRKMRPGLPGVTERGLSLVELLVTLAVIGVLAVAVGFMYQGWMGRYKVEKITKELHTDLMSTRSLAVTRNRMYFVTLVDANNYSVTEDVNESGISGDTIGGVSDAVRPTFPKFVQYTLNWNGAVPANQVISFDKRGIAGANGTFSFITAADVDPDYNCIVISQTRINMGKMNAAGTDCDVK